MADVDTIEPQTAPQAGPGVLPQAPPSLPTGAPMPPPPSKFDDSALGPVRPYVAPPPGPGFLDRFTQPGAVTSAIEDANPFAPIGRAAVAAAPEVVNKEIPYAHESSLSTGPSTMWDQFQRWSLAGQYGAESDRRENSTWDWIDKNVANIKDATGVDLPNPNYGGFSDQASKTVLDQISRDRANGTFTNLGDYADRTRDLQLQLFQQAKADLAAKHQTGSQVDEKILDAIQADVSPMEGALGLVKQARAAAQASYAGADAEFLPWLAATAGGIYGSFRNPVNDIALLAPGGILGKAPAALGFIGRTLWGGVDNALFNFALTAPQEPGRQRALAQEGEESGFVPAMKDLGDSMLYGFVPGAIIHGSRELFARTEAARAAGEPGPSPESMNEAFLRQARGWQMRKDIEDFIREKSARDAAAVAPLQIEGPRGPGEPPPPAAPAAVGPRGPIAPLSPLAQEIENLPRTTAVTPTAVEKAELDVAAAPPPVEGIAPTEMLSAYQGAVLHGEHPDAVAPPTPPIYAPRPPAVTLAPDLREGTPVTLSNVLPAQYGTPAILDGRPIMQNVVFDPRTLGTDAAAMQYKSGADAQGVTDRLAGVQKWDDLAANKIVVYQRLNGDLIVADGHQRLGLAKRLLAEGKESHIDLVGSLFKESDGWTPADVRAQAAAKNIKELSGSSLDIARVLRDRPGLWDSSFPVTDGKVKQGKGLAQLSDPAWGMALNGHVPLNHAALVGLNVPDKSLHEGIMSDLAQVKPANDNEARMVIADGQTAGYRKEIQEDIFGKTERTVTLRRERAQVYGAVVNLLKEDKRIFGMLDRNAAKIESIGNQLVDSNADQAARAGQLAQIIMKIAERQGPLSAALNRAADEVANGKPVAAAARQFLDKIDDALEAEGIKAAMLTPGAIDPSTPKGRAEQTTALLADAKAEPALTPEALGFAAAAPRAVASIEPSPAPLTTGDPLVDHVTSDPYVASAIADPIINRENDVPYGAGPNKALDRVVNVDRHVPATDKIGGVTYDPAQAVAVHEFTEQHALNELVAAGVPEAHAYEIAHFVFAEPAERAWIEANVGPKAWNPYQAHWAKWLKPIENESPKNPPPDLYQKPYPHDDDHLAPEDRGSDKAFEETGHRNLPELRAEAERVLGPGGGGAAAQLEQIARQAVANAHQALGASGTPLDRVADQAITEHVEPFLDRAFPKAPAVEAGPEGTQQTLMPGVEPVTDADRLRAAAAKPMTGGAAPMPAGGLFDENATAALDLWDTVATDRGPVPRDKLLTGVPLETRLAQFVRDCEP